VLSERKKFKMLKNIRPIFIFFVIKILFIGGSVHSTENSTLISLGNKNAKVTIKVFSSLTCPHCAHFHGKIFKELKKEFIDTNIVRFEHHGFPLDLAALNAEKIIGCINKTETRLKYLNEVYEKQSIWAVGSDINKINSNLIKIAKNYDLNDDKVISCLNDEKLEEEILSNRINTHKKYSIKSTPTIFINEKKYEGNHEYKNFKKAIEKFL
tara:strand:- start:2652 stop:3284 length:633 start_codon:yes stop_codon:yes gene_type:complete